MEPGRTVKTRRDEHTEATRRALLDAGREAFAEAGFGSAGIEAIARAARVTRGAFYHHFEDKTALFDAVVVELQAETAARIEAAARARPGLRDRLRAGIEAFLDAGLEAEYGRIVVHEAPVVLGTKRFREIEEAYPMSLLLATLEALARRGEIVCDDIGLLCRMLDAMICETALLLHDSGDPAVLRARALDMIERFLDAYRPPAASR